MRYAIIAHVLAHLKALQAVLGAINTAGIERSRILCLGNVVGNFKQPNECVSLLRDSEILTLLGGLDAVACGVAEPWGFESNKLAALMWTREVLSDESHSWLRQLPERFHFSEFDITHRTADYSEASPFQSAEERHPGERGRVCFVAHPNTTCVIPSHAILSLDATGTYTLAPDTEILISPGAVGRIRKNSPTATFGIFDTEAYSYREVYVPVS